jgi:signal transduction histidine kinase
VPSYGDASGNHRSARDLNDQVIQQLFAAGLDLQSLRRFAPDETAQRRITALATTLDKVITQVRDSIYALGPEPGADESLSGRIVHAVYGATGRSGRVPRLQFEGPINTALHGAAARHLLAVLAAGLDNSARHSGAGSISICVTAILDRICLTIDDDGHTPGVLNGPLCTLEQAARALKATLTVSSTSGQATRLRWEGPAATNHP